MISAKIVGEENMVYINVSGYISYEDTKRFLNDYKKMIKSIKPSKYRLVVEPSTFECENDNDIRNVCMAFLKSGYNKIYLVDSDNSIMNSLSLGAIEKKLFLKSVKFVKSTKEIK